MQGSLARASLLHVCQDRLIFNGKLTKKRCDKYAYQFERSKAKYRIFEYVREAEENSTGERCVVVNEIPTTDNYCDHDLHELGILQVAHSSTENNLEIKLSDLHGCLLYTSPSPRDS